MSSLEEVRTLFCSSPAAAYGEHCGHPGFQLLPFRTYSAQSGHNEEDLEAM